MGSTSFLERALFVSLSPERDIICSMGLQALRSEERKNQEHFKMCTGTVNNTSPGIWVMGMFCQNVNITYGCYPYTLSYLQSTDSTQNTLNSVRISVITANYIFIYYLRYAYIEGCVYYSYNVFLIVL